jgi:hypothetical protein
MGASGVVRQARRHGPSITYKITPCWVTLLQQVRWVAALASSLAFGFIGLHINLYSTVNYLLYNVIPDPLGKKNILSYST